MNYADVAPRKSHADFVNPSFETLIRRYFYQTETPRLETVVNKPYQGTGGKEFPLGNRRYGRRRYYVENKGTVTIKVDERVLGYVHTDDTFTFAIRPYMGDQALLNRLFPSFWLGSDSRRGGVIFKMKPSWGSSEIVHPVFPGLRVKLNDLTLHESINYHVAVQSLDKKLTKQLRDKYEDKFKAARGFFMATSAENIIADLNAGFSFVKDREDMYMRIVNKINLNLMPHRFRYNMQRLTVRIDNRREELFDKSRKLVLDQIYREERAFKKTIIEAGKPIPSGNWGYDIHVDKQEK